MTIKLIINGNAVELSPEAARELYKELGRLFAAQPAFTLPSGLGGYGPLRPNPTPNGEGGIVIAGGILL